MAVDKFGLEIVLGDRVALEYGEGIIFKPSLMGTTAVISEHPPVGNITARIKVVSDVDGKDYKVHSKNVVKAMTEIEEPTEIPLILPLPPKVKFLDTQLPFLSIPIFLLIGGVVAVGVVLLVVVKTGGVKK